MHIPHWMCFALVILLKGNVGLLQKLSTDYLSAESFLVWLVVGFQLRQPFVYRDAVFHYSARSLGWGILSGFLNAVAIDFHGLGEWFRNFMKELAPSRNVVCHPQKTRPGRVGIRKGTRTGQSVDALSILCGLVSLAPLKE